MKVKEVIERLRPFFPKTFDAEEGLVLTNPDGRTILSRVKGMSKEPIHLTHFNQILHLVHEAGISPGCFRYYFLSAPTCHPYPLDKMQFPLPSLNSDGIGSLDQAEWGLLRFFTDALVFWGDIRSAYREVRVMTHEQLEDFFGKKRLPTEAMRARGTVLPMNSIPMDDRYLISEIACKAYSPEAGEGPLHIEEVLLQRYRSSGGTRVKIKSLFEPESALAKEEPEKQLMLEFAAEEFMEEDVEDELGIKEKVAQIAARFNSARELAHQNTRLYLSFVNELDVYVATSMRKRDDFRNMAKDCEYIFKHKDIHDLKLRYFDPTISAAHGHEDKGLVECLMVKSARAVLYFAGEGDSFGKDAEIAMAMSLGKPVIILCPDSAKGRQREKMFRDIHPLSRLIEFDTGVAIGAMVTTDRSVVVELLRRIFCNDMQYLFEQTGDAYFRLRERETNTVVRLQTNWQLLREAFWNYYHRTP